jgi:AcrR family transcriptional regulator
MVSRERILEAAARVYAKHGFRGATTRLIAIEAGVNEVTLFRTFGSKGALLEAALACPGMQVAMASLPERPMDPAAELTAFAHAQLQKLCELRPFLVQTMSEFEERPKAADFACRGRIAVHETLLRYADCLRAQGMADESADLETAVTMLTSAVIGDVMGRPMVPTSYPPIEEAAARYVDCFLRMISVPDSAAKPIGVSRARIG